MSPPRSLFGKTSIKRPKIDNEEKQEHTTPQNTERNLPSTSSRKPAFNPALLSSAFYTGPTMYGGAGACSSSSYFNQYTKSKFYDRKKTDIKVTPSTPENSMSQTSRRILDLLEQYSSPISDAKRVPINNKSSFSAPKRILNSSIFDISNKSFAEDPSTPNTSKTNRFRELQIPSMATLMKIKKGNRSGSNSHAAILASMSSSLPYKPDAYSLRSDAGTYKSKIKSKLSSRSNKVDEEEMAQPVNLPNISLNITGLPTFTMEPFKPQLVTPKYTVSEKKEPTSATASASIVPNFKFTSPLAIGNTENLKASTKFHFRDPVDIFSPKSNTDEMDSSDKVSCDSNKIDVDKRDNSMSKLTSVESPSSIPKPKSDATPMLNFKAGDSNPLRVATKRPVDMWNGKDWKNKEIGKLPLLNGDIKSTSTLGKRSLNSSIGNTEREESNSEDKKLKAEPLAPSSSTPNLDQFIKKQQQQWECASCMTRNDPSKEKCVCCETPKPGAKPAPVVPTPTSATNNTGFSGMGNFIKKQQEQWECSCCMTRNDQNRVKCVCCEASKPGCEASKPAPAAAINFNFGTTQNLFKFGIDKANEPPATDSKLESKKPEASLPTSGFVFGNPSTTTETKTENGSVGGFKFGVPNNTSPFKPAETTTPPKPPNIFGEKKESTTPSVSTGGFTFGIKKAEEHPVTTTAPSTEPKTNLFTFSSPAKTESATVSDKPKLSFGTQVETKTTSAPFTLKPSVSTTTESTSTSVPTVTTSSAASPPVFSFGGSQPAAKPAFGNSTPFQFDASASAPTTTSTESLFQPSRIFSFGSKTSNSTTETTSTESPTKPSFQLPAANTGSLFPSTNISSPPKEPEKNSTAIGSGIQFSSNPLSEKPKDQSFFTFGSSSNVSNTGNTFKSPTSNLPVFTFGSASTTTKTESTLFNSPPSNSSPSLFGAKPSSEQTTPNLFKAPSASPSFTSPSTNIFGSSQGNNPQLPSSNVFGSGTLNTTTNKPPVPIFGSAPIPDAVSQPPQSNTLFSNSSVPPFNTNNIFGSTPQPNPVSPPQPSNMFGSPLNKPATEAGGMFMNNNQPSAAAGSIFGTALPAAAPTQSGTGMFGSSPSVPTPVFGASIPFGENSQNQSQQSVPFKFGAPSSTQAPGVGFGQAPAAGSSAPVFFGSGPSAPPGNSQFNFSMGAPSSAFSSTPGAMANPNQRRIKKAVRRNVLR